MSEPKYIWLYWPVRGFSVEPYVRTHPIGDSGEFRYTLTSGQEWDALMERARKMPLRYDELGSISVSLLRDLLAYFEGAQ